MGGSVALTSAQSWSSLWRDISQSGLGGRPLLRPAILQGVLPCFLPQPGTARVV